MNAKFSSSDLVQKTMLEAIEKKGQFRGESDRELAGWLRQALVHNLVDEFRAHDRDKRKADLEIPLQRAITRSSTNLLALIAGCNPSPSQEAMRKEDVCRLTAALDELPDLQREAIVLHHIKRSTLKETAEEMDRSAVAVAGLIHRGLVKLKELLSK